LSPGESCVDLVPVRDARLTVLPAEIHRPAVALRREIEQPRLERLAFHTEVVELLDEVLDLGRDALHLALQAFGFFA
jgi:hypothetical protein